MSDKKVTSNFTAAKQFVAMKRDHGQESLSGPGSWLCNTSESVEFINETIADYGVSSILDLGCGDWNWFSRVNLDGVTYQGWDADESMVADVSARHGGPSVTFAVKDIVLEDYPAVDLIVCRDVLFHMMPAVALAVLEKIQRSGALLIATSFRDAPRNEKPVQYTTFENWGYYDINLNIAPFNLLNREIAWREEKSNGNPRNSRFICLYDFRNC